MIIKVIKVMSILSLLLTAMWYVNVADAKLDEDTIQGMWTFEEGNGETVTDLSGNESDGTFVGDIKWAKAKFGDGLQFSGVAAPNFVRIGTKGDADSLAALDFKASEGFSIHAWVYAEEPPVGKCVIWKGRGCSTWSQYLLGTGAHENGDGNVNKASFHIRAGNGGARQEVLGDELPAKEWLHLVGVWDGAKAHIYVNGELQNSADVAGPPWASPEEVYIGADPGCNNNNGRCHWNGIMDEIVIFNTALSENDVKLLGNGIEGALAVDAVGKTTTTWGTLKRKRF